jgi:hypothetical protein
MDHGKRTILYARALVATRTLIHLDTSPVLRRADAKIDWGEAGD